MTRRAAFNTRDLTALATVARETGVRMVARIGGVEVIADPHAPALISAAESPDAALDGWARKYGDRIEGSA